MFLPIFVFYLFSSIGVTDGLVCTLEQRPGWGWGYACVEAAPAPPVRSRYR